MALLPWQGGNRQDGRRQDSWRQAGRPEGAPRTPQASLTRAWKDAPATPPETSAAQRMLLGRYRVLSTNDEGGFGTVSTCWDTRLQRRVAIKRMPLSLEGSPALSTSTLEEALTEARTSSMLSHPNIVTVYDFETDDTSSYLVMEYVDGLNLQELLARVEGGVLTFDECAHVLDSVGGALAFAHENGVLHLDIKPANIMIDRNGVVKLADFGMASLASAAGFEGARGGTVGYMPPEQIMGDYVDERTDIFSLAVVAWQSLTGSCPYAAPTPEQSLEKIRRGPTPALSKVEPELAGMVENTLLQALDPSPKARMSSIEDMVHNTVTYLGDERAGQESLAWLITQSAEGETQLASAEADLSIWERFPWLEGALVRASAAVVTSVIVGISLHFALNSFDTLHLLVCALIAAAASAALPILGAPIAASTVLFALAGGGSLAFPLGFLIGASCLAWWIGIGRWRRMGAYALLTAPVLCSPMAAAAAAGGTLNPAYAAPTAALSWVYAHIAQTVVASGFNVDAIVQGLLAKAQEPLAWAALAVVAAAACVCAWVRKRQSLAAQIVAYVLMVSMLAAFQVTSSHVENIANWGAVGAQEWATVIVLSVVMCVTTVLHGPSDGVEGDLGHERS
ncbi:MAG: serine/threonine-protein kinase [Atopobiaceae bacterium]